MPSAEFIRLRKALEHNRRPPGEVDVADFRAALERSAFPVDEGVRVEPAQLGGVAGAWLSPKCHRDDRALLYLHGGGFVIGRASCRERVCHNV